MVAIVTGAGYGLERSSAFVLGSQGQVGQSQLGRLGQDVFVNAATGLLNISRNDEILIGRGPDQDLNMDYYSGISAWRQGWARVLFGLSGTVNTAGSTITFVKDFNDRPTFTYDVAKGAYVSKEGGGAYDQITFAAGKWSFTDGDTQVTEYFEHEPFGGVFYISRVVDADGNTQTYTYPSPTSSMVTKITNADGNYTEFTYTGSRPNEVKTTYTNSSGGTSILTRVRYIWDPIASSRLNSLIVDLTPEDNSIADGNTYVTNYGYDAAGRVSSISQTDGSLLGIEYDGSGRVWKLTQTAATGVTRLTTLTYFTGYTNVTDAQGGVTTLAYDAQGQLTQLTMPAGVAGGTARTTSFTYNANGDVISSTNAAGTTVYEYDGNGNQTLRRDPLGNSVARVYNSRNQLLRETVYLVPDPDGNGAGVPSAPQTTRYVYDPANNRLRYVVTGDGRVTYLFQNSYGLLTTKIEYRLQRYDVSALTPAQDIPYATISAWAGNITDFTQTRKTTFTYDVRGNLQSESTYGQTAANSNGITASDSAIVNYVYDQAGNLLTRKVGNQPAQTFAYDGLGRMIVSTDPNTDSVNIAFNDSANSTLVTLANGRTETSVYNRAGELISFAASNSIVTATTTYKYDSLGRLRIVTDATGVKTHHLFDRAGRKVAEIGQDGSITELVYNTDNLLVATIGRANKLTGAQLALLVDGSGNPTNVALSAVQPGAHADDRYAWNVYDAAHRLIETIDGTGAVTQFGYDGASRLISTKSFSNRIVEATVNGFKTLIPTALVLPTADPARDRLTRNFYDADDLLIGTLDGEGGFTEHRYDGAGLHSKTIRYADPVGASLRASGTFAQLLADITADNANDIHSYSLFDNRGALRATIDGEGNLVRYRYANYSGFLDQEIRGQKLDPAALLIAVPWWNALPAAGAGEILETIGYTRNNAGDVTTETRTLASGAAEYTTYSYDKLRTLLSTTVQGAGDFRTYNHRYDLFGRLIGELSGEGSAALAALGANPAPATVDTLYLTWGTTYSYDLAGRLVATTRPNGVTAAANRSLFYYDEHDNLRYQINAAGEVVEYRYNALGDRTDTIIYATRVTAGVLATLNGGLVNAAVTAAVVASAGSDSRTRVDYNVTGTVKQSFDAIGYATGLSYATTYSYNAFGELTGRVDPIAAAATVSSALDYDRRGLLASETRDSAAGGLQLITGFTYDAFGRQTEVRDPDLKLRKLQYDRAGRIVRKTDATAAFELYSYDARGNVMSSTDRTGKVTNYSYTRFNRTITMTTPEGLTTTTLRNAHGETISITDHAGRFVTYGYDKSGNLKSVVDAAAGDILNNYDKAGRLFEEIDARGVKTVYTYDAAARMLTREVDDGAGRLNLLTTWEYDGQGRQIKVTDPTLTVTRIEFDLNGRRTAVIADDGGLNLRTEYSYDRSGRRLTVKEGAGTPAAARVTTWDYDKAGRIIDSWVDKGGLNLRTHYLYDKRGNVTNVMDAAGNVTVYTYDDENRQVLAADAEGRLTRTSYDAEGRVIATRRYASLATLAVTGTDYGVTKYAISATPSDSINDEVKRYVHDGDGRLRFSIDPLGHPCQYEYDGSGNLLRKTEYAGAITWVATDTVATLQGKIAGLAVRVTRAFYDSAGRRTFAIDAAGQVTAYGYDANSNAVKSILYKNAYTGADSLAAVQTWAGQQALADARISRTIYDGASRAVYEAVEAGALGTGSHVTEYRYDAAGQVTQQIRYADKYSVTDATTQAALDGLIPDTLPASAARTLYAYDDAGRLTDVTDAENSRTHFILDATGLITDTIEADGTTDASTTRRVFDKGGRVVDETRGFGTTAATTTHSVYDGVGRAVETLVAYQSGDESKTVRVFDSAGRLESETRGYGTAEAATTTYGWDEHGNLETQTDGLNHTIVRTYDAAGRMLTETVPIAAGTGAVTRKYYDSFGNVVRLEDPRGNSGYFYYDALNRLTLQVDPEKYATATTYSAGGEVASVTRYWLPLTGTISEAVKPVPPTHALDATTIFTRDRLDRLTAVTDAEYYVESYQLDAFGNRTQVTRTIDLLPNPDLTATTVYTFDRMGRVTSELLPVGSTLANGTIQSTSVTNKFEYDARGNRSRTIEAFGLAEARTTVFVYDKLDRLIEKRGDTVSVVAQDLATVSNVTPVEYYSYDKRGNLIESKDPLGARSLFFYDDLDRKVAELSALGTLSTFEIDDNGNIEKSRVYGTAIALPALPGGTPPAPPAGEMRETTYTYDWADRLLTTSVAGLRTGAWTGSAWSMSVGAVTTSIGYDLNGNIVTETDGNNNITYSYYDKLNRKTAQVDRENYLTAWVLDGEGNAKSERRYQTRFVGTPGIATPPSVANHADDRITNFTYDRNGRRLTEERAGVANQVIDAVTGAVTAASSTAIIRYAYNGLGLVTRKTEANGEVTDFEYDLGGRLIRTKAPQFTDHLSATVVPVTENFHDGLGNVVRTEVNKSGGAAGDDRVTQYSYGAGGRLILVTDAAAFTRSYGYDAAGRVVKESWTRLKSDGATQVTEASAYRYDGAGRMVTETTAVLSGGSWTFGDATRIRYNAYGEVTGRGITAGPNDTAVYQEVIDYDLGGRVWRTTADDGVLRFNVYDKAGNQTLTLASAGADLAALTLSNYADSIGSTGDTSIAGAVTTLSLFDKRGQATGSREPDRQLSASATAVVVRARTYNAFGEVASETDPRGFDASGNAIAFSGGAGFTTTFTYNSIGRLLSKVSPQVSVTAENGGISNANPTEYYGYDLSGRLVSIQDANGNRITRLLLAGSGHGGSEALVTKEFHPDTGVAETRYDMFGDARALINEVGSTELRDYDKLGRLTVQYHPIRAAGTYGNSSGGAVQLIDYFAYDALGRRTQHWNSQLGSGVKERTDYDSKGRVVSTIVFGGDTTVYAYAWNASLATSSLGTFGGWTRTTINFASLTMTEGQDYFGRIVDRIDCGGHNYDFAFDKGGRLTGRSNSAGESIGFTYFGTGLLAGQTGTQGVAAYGYDSAGNRVSETFSKNGIGYRSGTAAYDAMGRMTNWADSGFGGAAPASTLWEYDKVGNVRHIESSHRTIDLQGNIGSTATPISEWYLYDSMNRFTLVKGVLVGARGSGTIERGSEGIAFTYYFDGNRRSALQTATLLGSHYVYTYNGVPMPIGDPNPEQQGTWEVETINFQGDRREDYFYTADGFLAASDHADATYHPEGPPPEPGSWEAPEPVYRDPPAVGAWLSRSTLDAMGRTISYKEYAGFDGSFERTAIDYDAAGRFQGETTITIRRDTVGGVSQTYTTYVDNTYTNGMLSQQVNDTRKNGNDGDVPDSRQTYSYTWWDGALQASIGNDNDNGGAIDWWTTYSYDSSGHVTSAAIGDGRPRTVTFVTDQNGMIVDRDEADNYSAKGDPRNLNYFFAGTQMAQIGNNGTDNMNYTAAVKDRLAPLPTSLQNGAFRNGSTVSTPFADFAQSYDAINAHNNAPTGSSYTAQGGETLAMVAQNLWGDSQLWYLIAQANGLGGSETLVAGQVVTIPNKLHNVRNAADTFRVYDPNEAIGDTSPVDAKPPKKPGGCGVVGQIIAVVIAIAVTKVTGSPELGNIASQLFLMAIGQQEKFSWKQLAITSLTAGLNMGVNASGVFKPIASATVRAAVTAATVNAATQGVAVATGLQKRFDWTGVAAAGVVAGVSTAAGKALQPTGLQKQYVAGAGRMPGMSQSEIGMVSNMAGSLAGAATRSLLSGTDFGDNLIAVLPDVIGSTLGNMIGSRLAERPEPVGSSDYEGDAIDTKFEGRDVASPVPGPQILFSDGTSRPYNILVDPIEFPRLDPIEIDLGGLDLGPFLDPALAANTPRAQQARRGWVEFEQGVASARDREDILRDLKGAPSRTDRVSPRQTVVKGYRDIEGGPSGDTSLIGGVLTNALARDTNDDVMGWLFENGLFVEGFNRHNITDVAVNTAIDRMAGEASDFQLRGGITFFTSMSDAPVYGSFAAKAANALAAERQRRLETPEARAAEREVRKVDMFFGGIIAAWTAPLSVPLIMEGGVAAGVGYLALASSTNHAASATAPFTGIDRPLLDHFTFDGATTGLDIAAGVSGLTYGSVRTGQSIWSWHVARRGDGLSDFTRRYLTESGGRWGGTSTRNQNYAISQELERRGYRVSAGGGIGPEEHIAGPNGGLAGGSFVDITAMASNGRTVRIQTVTTLGDGVTPTPGEAAAAARIRAAFPNDKLVLVPKTGK